jgi:hypothetical protein
MKTTKNRAERLRILEARAMDVMSAINQAECTLKWMIEEIRSLKHAAQTH